MQGWRHFKLLLSISRARRIARRYAVVNGFDGALTMLGLLTGFRTAGDVEPAIVVSACLGAATALAASGITSAYLSEQAERRRELRELEVAMAEPIRASAHGEAARIAPIVIALSNGLSPLVIALVIMAPLWLASAGHVDGDHAVLYGIALAFVAIFVLGALLGRIGHTFWLWSAIRAVLIGAITCGVILGLR